jgi:hypothetical protein
LVPRKCRILDINQSVMGKLKIRNSGVNFTNILQGGLAPIFLHQKEQT